MRCLWHAWRRRSPCIARWAEEEAAAILARLVEKIGRSYSSESGHREPVTFFRPAVSLPCRPFLVYQKSPAREITMDARLDYNGSAILQKFVKHINSAGRVITESTLPRATQELVKIRASQINGCGFCTDMHTKDAAHAGESQVRLNLVAVWRGATGFTQAQRGAPGLTEQGAPLPPPPRGAPHEGR